RGQASALAGGGDGVADLDLSPGGRALEPPEADEGAVVVEEEVGSPRVGVLAAGGVEGVWESFGESGPSLDHGDAESFGEGSVAVDQCLDPLEPQRLHPHYPPPPPRGHPGRSVREEVTSAC